MKSSVLRLKWDNVPTGPSGEYLGMTDKPTLKTTVMKLQRKLGLD